LATAKTQLATGLLKDQQALATAKNQIASQALSARSTAAGIAVAAAPPQPGTVAQGQAGVEQAQISLQTAQQTLADTTLRAPVYGTVSAVSGVTGEQIGSGGGASTTTASSSSSSSGSSSGSSSSSGFVTITNLTAMQVVSGFSETDAAKLRVRHAETVTVEALPGQQLAAHVIAIDTNA